MIGVLNITTPFWLGLSICDRMWRLAILINLSPLWFCSISKAFGRIWGTDFGRNGWRSGKLLVLLSFHSLFSFLSGSSWKHSLYEYERVWHFKSCAFDSFCSERVACYGCLLWRQQREKSLIGCSLSPFITFAFTIVLILFLCGRFEMVVVYGIGCRKVHVSVNQSGTILLLCRCANGAWKIRNNTGIV